MQNPPLLSSVGDMEAEQLLHHTSVHSPASLTLLLGDAFSLAPLCFPIKKDPDLCPAFWALLHDEH